MYYEIDAEIENDIIQEMAPLSSIVVSSWFQCSNSCSRVKHFYDVDDGAGENDRKGAIIKSPVDLLMSASRYFSIPTPDMSNLDTYYGTFNIYDYLSIQADMEVFESPEVAGWPAYFQEPFYNRNWINGTTLVNRFSAMAFFIIGIPVNNGNFIFKLDIVDYVANQVSTPADPNVVVDELTLDLFPYGMDQTKRDSLKDILLDGDIDAYWTQTWADYLQGGNEITVRLRLEALISAILQSPEYQLQ